MSCDCTAPLTAVALTTRPGVTAIQSHTRKCYSSINGICVEILRPFLLFHFCGKRIYSAICDFPFRTRKVLCKPWQSQPLVPLLYSPCYVFLLIFGRSWVEIQSRSRYVLSSFWISVVHLNFGTESEILRQNVHSTNFKIHYSLIRRPFDGKYSGMQRAA